jgi:hypothetical protein
VSEIKNPLKNKKAITWEEYKPIYIRYNDEKYEKLRAQSAKYGSITLKETCIPQRMEVIMKENKINNKERNELLKKAFSERK